jgi:hypothetical protein
MHQRHLFSTVVSKSAAFLFWAFFIPIAASAAAADHPTVTITSTAITASGVTPGTQVAFFGVGLEPKGYHAEVHRWSAAVPDAAHGGTATFTFDAPVTWNVVWIVVDLQTGHYTVASTPGFPTMTARRPRYRLRHDATGSPSQMGYGRPFVDALYVEHGGAWTMRAQDGDSTDADGTPDGQTTIDLSRATPLVAGSDAPRQFSPSGTLFVIDVSRLEVLPVPIDTSLIAGAQ